MFVLFVGNETVTIDKDLFVGDQTFNSSNWTLIDKKYAFEQSNDVEKEKIADVKRLSSKTESKDTTHLSVIDSDGNAVSMTHSLGMPLGW